MALPGLFWLRAALFLLTAALAAPTLGETISLRADEWCPVTCEPNSDRPGYMIELAMEIFARADIRVDYQLMPSWKRVAAMVKEGVIEGAVGARRDEISGTILPAIALGRGQTVLAVRQESNFVFENTGSFLPLKVGVVADYDLGNSVIAAYIRQHHEWNDGKIEFAYGENALLQNMRKLFSARLDGVLENESVLLYKLHKIEPHPPVKLVPVDQPADLTIALSPANPKSPRDAKILSDGIIELRKSGRLQKILQNYGLSDWE